MGAVSAHAVRGVRLSAGGHFMGLALEYSRVFKGLSSDPTFTDLASAYMAVGWKLGTGGPLKGWSWYMW